MKELSLNILDITENSVKAKASLISISLSEDENGILTLIIADNGCGMDEETKNKVTDPFYTTRTTRKVGIGLPLLKLASEQALGEMKVESEKNVGTTVTATFDTKSIDFTPIGDMTSTIVTLILGSPEIDFEFTHTSPILNVKLFTKELREQLGDVPLDTPEVITWIREYLDEQYNNTEDK